MDISNRSAGDQYVYGGAATVGSALIPTGYGMLTERRADRLEPTMYLPGHGDPELIDGEIWYRVNIDTQVEAFVDGLRRRAKIAGALAGLIVLGGAVTLGVGIHKNATD